MIKLDSAKCGLLKPAGETDQYLRLSPISRVNINPLTAGKEVIEYVTLKHHFERIVFVEDSQELSVLGEMCVGKLTQLEPADRSREGKFSQDISDSVHFYWYN